MTPPARTTLSLIACGVVLAGALGAAGQIDARGEAGRFVALMMVAASAYVAALRLVWRGPAAGGGAFAACVLLAVVARAAIAGGAPLVSDDVYRYLWDGRVQQFGLSPYEAAPVDPALAGIHTEATRRIDPTSAVLPSLYPPLAQRFFLAVTAVDDSVAAMVAAVVVCDLLTLLVLWRWLVTSGRNRWWVLAYAWHPLVILEGAAGGARRRRRHAARRDGRVGAGAPALPRGGDGDRRGGGGEVLAAGAAAAPLAAGCASGTPRWRGAGVALLYLPFMQPTGVLPIGSLATYAAQWRFNGPLFRWIEAWVGVPGAVAAAVGAGLAAAVLARRRLPPDAPARLGVAPRRHRGPDARRLSVVPGLDDALPDVAGRGAAGRLDPGCAADVPGLDIASGGARLVRAGVGGAGGVRAGGRRRGLALGRRPVARGIGRAACGGAAPRSRNRPAAGAGRGGVRRRGTY